MRLSTERLDLFPLDVRALDAWVAGDVPLLRELTGAGFQTVAPPLLDEDLRMLRDMAAGAGESWYWAVWAFVLRESLAVVGAGGCGTGPDAQGVIVFGYSIYPVYQRRGFATEASGALVDWYFTDPRVRVVRATVPPHHTPSVRVVEKCGLVRVGADVDPKAGPIGVFEKRRPCPNVAD
jgi:RimJ/RimL family protein N-acetyltransferase